MFHDPHLGQTDAPDDPHEEQLFTRTGDDPRDEPDPADRLPLTIHSTLRVKLQLLQSLTGNTQHEMGEWLGIGRDAVARAARGEGFRSAELIDAMTAGGLWDREARFVALAYGAQDERHLLNALGAKQYPIVRYFVTKTLAEAFTVVRGVLARKPPFADGGADPLTPERAMPYLRVGRAYLRSKFDKKKIPEDWHEDIIQEALVDMFSGARWWFVEDPLRYFKGVVRSTAHDWLREKQL